MEENDYNYDSFYLLNFYGGDKKIDKFEGAPSRKKFVSWIEAKSPWIVHHLDEFDNFSDLKDKYKSLPIFTMFFPQDDFPSQDSLIRQIELVSDSFKHSILFSYYSLYVPFPFILLLPSFQVFFFPFYLSGREISLHLFMRPSRRTGRGFIYSHFHFKHFMKFRALLLCFFQSAFLLFPGQIG